MKLIAKVADIVLGLPFAVLGGIYAFAYAWFFAGVKAYRLALTELERTEKKS